MYNNDKFYIFAKNKKKSMITTDISTILNFSKIDVYFLYEKAWVQSYNQNYTLKFVWTDRRKKKS